MSRRTMIGFDRKLELEWLDMAAAQALTSANEEELRAQLLSYLTSLSHDNEESGSARAKTARVLMRIWGNVTPEMEPLHRHALGLLSALEPGQRLALHWAMTVAAYPFFADIAAALGRLLALQETVTAAQLRRRIAELWGERETVFRTSRHVIRSMVAWSALDDAGKGTYRRSRERRVVDGELASVLLEAVLLTAEHGSIPFDQASRHPALFPFTVRLDPLQVRESDRMRLYRQGLDADVLVLAR